MSRGFDGRDDDSRRAEFTVGEARLRAEHRGPVLVLLVLLAGGCTPPDSDGAADAPGDGPADAGDGGGVGPEDAAPPDGPGDDVAAGEDEAGGGGEDALGDEALGEDAPADEAEAVPPACIDEPSAVTPDPPIEVCDYMDWRLSADGFYKISRFGTTNDPTTMGRTTTCGFLQGHYDGHDCVWDNRSGACVGDDHAIPWAQGSVDYVFEEVIAEVEAHLGEDVPTPEYFYVAGAQRFRCGSLLRVTNPANGKCIVAYAEDGGPNGTYEDVGYGERRILDSSPAVVRWLEVVNWGWRTADLVYVEWGLPGDVPGRRCTRCESAPAADGYAFLGTPFDVNHMLPYDCGPAVCGDGVCGSGEDHASCPADCAGCGPITAAGRVIDETDGCFRRGGTPGYWHAEADGWDGSLLWTEATAAASPDNYGVWDLEFEVAGEYALDVYTDGSFAQSRQARYEITAGGASSSVVVDQTSVDGWTSLGRHRFDAGGGQSVRLDDNTGEAISLHRKIVFDALRVVPAS
jgi:hypothetical protein